MTVRIVTDSACDLPQSVIDELGIEVVPLTIRFGEHEFVDRRDLTPKEFWARCGASPTLPETAAPSPGQFAEAYQRHLDAGASGIVVVNLSSALSATMQSAELAATSFDGRVSVVDSRSATLGEGMVVMAAARAAARGASIAEVVAAANESAARTKVFGALDTLDNLKKGGRIGNAKALLASVLSIKPIIEIRDGKVEEGGKQRTRSKALAFVVEQLRACAPVEQVAVMHADCADVAAFADQVRAVAGVEPIIGDIGPVVGSHAGIGTMGVAFQVRG